MPRVVECITLILNRWTKDLKCYVLMGKGFKIFYFDRFKCSNEKKVSRSVYFTNQEVRVSSRTFLLLLHQNSKLTQKWLSPVFPLMKVILGNGWKNLKIGLGGVSTPLIVIWVPLKWILGLSSVALAILRRL